MLAAVGLAALTLTAPATTGAGGYWIVLASDRDGQTRGYSVRPDGTRLSPLLPLTRALVPADISADGRVVVHHELYEGGAYVSRANGTGFHRVPGGRIVSRDGKLLAFARLYEKDKRKNGIWVVGADGRGLRHIASNRELDLEDWSPDGKALLLIASGDDRSRLIVQPLHGTARVIARGPDFGDAAWSPSGRWIAWSADRNGKDELDVVEPSGADRHRVLRGEPRAFAWSPNGSTLAVAFRQGPLTIVDADGRRLRRLPLTPSLAVASELRWSPDGRLLAVKPDFRSDIWVIGVDGHGLRQVTKGGTNDLVGWTGLAPGQPPAPALAPSERVLDADTVATRTPVADLSADGNRVAFIVKWTAIDCDHVVVWTPAPRDLDRFGAPTTKCDPSTGAGEKGVELAGSRAAWQEIRGCGNDCEIVVQSATLDQRARVALTSHAIGNTEDFDFGLHGDGDLLVFNEGSSLMRVGGGRETCGFTSSFSTTAAKICTTLRKGAHAAPVESVSAGMIAIREPDAVAVLDAHGALVRVFPFGRDEVRAGRLDGARLVVARPAVLEVYDVATGKSQLQRPLPAGYRLTDVDGGIAVLRKDDTIMLLRLDDGRSFTLTPGRGHRFAELEAPGLYYSYATATGEGRVEFMPRADVERRLLA